MQPYRLLFIVFFLTLAGLCFDWPETWPAAAAIAAGFWGLYRWLGLELAAWFGVILGVLAFGMAVSAYPLSTLLLFLAALLGCLVLTSWEAALVVGDGWRAWRRWRARKAAPSAKGE